MKIVESYDALQSRCVYVASCQIIISPLISEFISF